MAKHKFSELTFVSSNRSKYLEYCLLIGLADLKLSNIAIEEPQSQNLETLVREKINRIKTQLISTPFFVDHTGLCIDAWNGLPGGLISQFMDCVGNEGICKMLQAYQDNERSAKATVVIGSYDQTGVINCFRGEVFGTIAPEPRGRNDFGWDAIFIPEGDSRTYAEMTEEKKSQTSMRREAVDRFTRYLLRNFEF